MDFAELGIKVDTNDLDLTVQQLKKLQPAAAGAAAATDKLSRAVEGMSTKALKAAEASAKAALLDARASKDKLIATGKATKADLEAAKAAIEKAKADVSVVKAAQGRRKEALAQMEVEQQATRVTNAATLAMKKQDAALAGIAGRVGGRGGGGNMPTPANDLMPNRFNTANIAAQFQDIGVTAAMGMNPLTIALQQGTQLSAILNTMENPLKGIAVAFRSILNPVSLLSIAMVGLIAAGAQMVDWVSVGQGLLNGLAGAFDFAAENADVLSVSLLALGITLVALRFQSIVTGLSAMVVGMVSLAAATWAIIAPFAAAGAAAVLFGGILYAVFGNDFINAVKQGINTGVGLMVGFFNAVKGLFTDTALSKIFVGAFLAAFNAVTKTIENAINDWIKLINLLLDKLPETIKEKVGFDKLSEVSLTIDNSLLGDGLRDAGQIIGDSFSDALSTDWVSVGADKISSAAKAASEKLSAAATGLGQSDEKSKKGAKSQAELYDELVGKTKQRIESLKIEQRAIFMTAQAAAQLRYQTELLNDAKNKGIDLTAVQTSELMQYASEMSAIEERTRQLNEAYDLVRDTGKGFFQDMKNGLREGKSAWESFSDAVTNALNRIMDKFFEASLDMVFDNIGSSSSGGGNFISTIADMLFNAKGNAFTPSGVEKFANGGAFTNSIVTSPTMFAFANGGKFGVMGEAGAEAVMPLRRGSDGSLGVQVVGGAGGSPVVVNVINNSGAQARTEQRQTANGQEIDVFIDDVVASKIGSQGTSSNRALQESNNRQLIRRR